MTVKGSHGAGSVAPGEPPCPAGRHPDAATVAQVLDLVGKGQANGIFLTTDDIGADYRTLTARGVESVEPPEERFYGIDAGFRDPSGNHIRLTQPLPASEWSDRRGG